jgi:diacylglycerol kinase (ATP)
MLQGKLSFIPVNFQPCNWFCLLHFNAANLFSFTFTIVIHPTQRLLMFIPPNQGKPTFTSSIKKLIRSFGYAFKGIKYAAITQLNFRVHLVATLLALYMGYSLNINRNEWQWIILCITLVLVAELINTAIETLTDLVSPQFNEKAGQVKDVAAGAVVITALFALVTGLIIFLPKLLILINYAA